MADRYYVNLPLAPGEVLLQGAEAHHLATVLRAGVGDAVTLFDGNGSEFPARITDISKRTVSLHVSAAIVVNRELPIAIEVASAVPKGDREEFLIQKLAELGVSRFVPLATHRSVVVPKSDRLRRAVIEASKQCGRNVLMAVAEVTPCGEFFRTCSSTTRLIAHRDELSGPLPDQTSKPNITIAVGPEGGWTADELKLAIESGWQAIDLGSRTLRIETAAIALAAFYSLRAISA